MSVSVAPLGWELLEGRKLALLISVSLGPGWAFWECGLHKLPIYKIGSKATGNDKKKDYKVSNGESKL